MDEIKGKNEERKEGDQTERREEAEGRKDAEGKKKMGKRGYATLTSLLVVGSSLEVYSAYRFIQRVADQGTPLAILNLGRTRASRTGIDCLSINLPCGDALPYVDELLSASSDTP